MSLSDKSAVDATRLGGRRWYMDDCAVLGGHVDSTGCLGARKCQGLGSSRRFV